MHALKMVLLVTLSLGLLAACSDDTVATDGKPLVDGPPPADSGPDGPITNPDQGDTDGGPTAALQTVVNKLLLPMSAADYAFDIDQDGNPDNAMGGILGALVGAGLFTQQDMDDQINNGFLLLLFELFAASLTDDLAASVQFHMGADLDSDPSDNFLGSEEFAIAAASPPNVSMGAKLTGGKLDGGPGDFQIPIPMGVTSIVVNLKQSHLTGDVSSGGIANGQINGAMPWTDVDQQLIPAIADMTDATYKSSTTPQATKDMIKFLLDLNQDGTVTADEIRNSPLLKIILKPDLDLDKDGTKDAMSVGLGFTAVSCIIKKN